MMVLLSHERKVRSLAKKTFGSMRVGSAMRFPGADWRSGCVDMVGGFWGGGGELGGGVELGGGGEVGVVCGFGGVG